MQLLEVTKKMFTAASILYVSMGLALADVKCNSANLTNPDIVTCSQAAFVKIDKVLNDQYKALSLELDASLKSELLAVQKDWIKLKEGYCNDEGEGGAGAEAPIDKLSCIKQLTSFRLSELIYLRTGVIGDGFYKAVSVVNEKATAMDYSKAVEYVAGDVDFGPLWNGYAEKNCAMTQKLYGEAPERCMARMRFQMPIY
jgi:uncharacterized protein YecT (DUF1311 family)